MENGVERSSRQGTNYRLDGEPRAVYYWPYRQTYERLKQILIPGSEITETIADEQLITVALFGNSKLNWNTFDLRKSDREPVGRVTYPGKSAHIDFFDLDTTQAISKQAMSTGCWAVLNRECKRQDNLYIAAVGDIAKAGYRVFFAPHVNHPLHLRIVAQEQIEDSVLRDVGKARKTALLGAFRKVSQQTGPLVGADLPETGD